MSDAGEEIQGGRSDPIELDSKTILIQNKRFYLDVKENDRGRFLKIAEVTPGGHKNRVTMAMQLLPEFRDHLSDFIDHYVNLGPPQVNEDGENDANRRPLKTARIVSGPRRYFLDLKENVRGRYLRIRAPGQHQDMPQQVVVIPALGIVEFRNTVSKVIEEFGVEQYKEETEINEDDLPNSAVVGSRRTKIFYFDVGKNNRGIYCRMTEQSANFRQSLTVPDRYFREIGEWFLNAADHLEGGTGRSGEIAAGGDNNHSTSRNSDRGHPQNNNNQNNNRNNNNRKPRHNNNNNDGNGLGNRRRSRDDDEYSE